VHYTRQSLQGCCDTGWNSAIWRLNDVALVTGGAVTPTRMALSLLRVWAAKSVTEAVRIRSSLRGSGMSLEYTDAVAAEGEMLAYQPTTRG
jgi:hypothetical protein